MALLAGCDFSNCEASDPKFQEHYQSWLVLLEARDLIDEPRIEQLDTLAARIARRDIGNMDEFGAYVQYMLDRPSNLAELIDCARANGDDRLAEWLFDPRAPRPFDVPRIVERQAFAIRSYVIVDNQLISAQ